MPGDADARTTRFDFAERTRGEADGDGGRLVTGVPGGVFSERAATPFSVDAP